MEYLVQFTTGRAALLHMVNTAAKCGAAQLKEARGSDAVRAFERAW